MAKAVLLLSGGLDSTLAGKLLIEMGIEVEAINFISPFCRCTPKSLGCSAAQKAAKQIGIPVKVCAVGNDYLEIIKQPQFGRGKGMNPCLDCRIHFFSHAKEYMRACGADFVATGEVLGERPMSQRRHSMELIERKSGLTGFVLRPLSARLFPPTIPEKKHLVDRNRLLAIQGRCRTPQFELAEKLGIKEYLCPAGGCLLTDPEFSARFKDLLEHDPGFSFNDANLLKQGRHFRLPSGSKAVVGRNESENKLIENLARTEDIQIVPKDLPGPTVLCRGIVSYNDILIAAGLVATYTKSGTTMDIEIKSPTRRENGHNIRNVKPLDKNIISKWRIGISLY